MDGHVTQKLLFTAFLPSLYSEGIEEFGGIFRNRSSVANWILEVAFSDNFETSFVLDYQTSRVSHFTQALEVEIHGFEI